MNEAACRPHTICHVHHSASPEHTRGFRVGEPKLCRFKVFSGYCNRRTPFGDIEASRKRKPQSVTTMEEHPISCTLIPRQRMLSGALSEPNTRESARKTAELLEFLSIWPTLMTQWRRIESKANPSPRRNSLLTGNFTGKLAAFMNAGS